MKVLKKIIPILFAIAVSILMIISRATPSGKLWNYYSVLYADTSVPDSFIIETLKTFGVENYVCASNQGVPYVYKNEFLDKMTIRITSDFKDFSYLKDRQNYFYDKSGKFRLYYAPVKYKKALASSASYISTATGVKAGIDSSSSYMRFLVIFFVVFAAILFVFCKNKLLFLSASILSAIYSFCFPFYASVVAACLFVLCIFVFCGFWNRVGAFKQMYKNVFIPIILVFTIVLAFSSGILSGLFYLLNMVGSISVIISYYYLEQLYESRLSFNPVMIRPAKMISPYGGRKKIIFFMALLITGMIIVVSFIASSGNFSVNSTDLLLPAASTQKADELPQLDDYYRWNWNIVTYPYRSLNTADVSDDYVAFPRFEYTEGKINEHMDVMIYNEEFKDEVLNQIDELSYDSIEKVLKTQNSDFVPGYMSSTSYQVHFFSIISMIVCFTMLLFIYISAIIRKGGKK